MWPVTRDFVRTDLPEDEIKTGGNLIAACFRADAVATVGAVRAVENKLEKLYGLPVEAITRFEDILNYSNNFQSRIRVVARIWRGWGSGMRKEVNWSQEQVKLVTEEPNRQEMLHAEMLIVKHGMISTQS